jgi:competence protein ComEC
MATAAGTPRFGIACAAALLVGVVVCLWSPWLASWPWLLSAALSGSLLWWRGERQSLFPRLAGAVLLGFGLAGLHAAHALWLQLPCSVGKARCGGYRTHRRPARA